MNTSLWHQAAELPDDDRHDLRARVCRHCDGTHVACGCHFHHAGFPTPDELGRAWRVSRAILAAIRAEEVGA